MKKSAISLSAVLLVSVFTTAFADVTYVCTRDKQERVITVVYKNPDAKIPCEVTYVKEGATAATTLWSAAGQEGYCEEKAEGFVQKQTNWGWECGEKGANGGAAQ